MKSFPMIESEEELWRKVLNGFDEEIYGVEIGCLYGDSANVILTSSPLIHLISIDPFIPDSMEKSLIGSYEDSVEKNKKFITCGRYRILTDYSWNVVDNWQKNSFDFIFLDGDHRYESILRDYNDWIPKLKVGGLLFIHDSRMSRPDGATFHKGPSQVADEYIFNNPDKWEIVAEAFSLTCARKLI
jgi:hypothetical protein